MLRTFATKSPKESFLFVKSTCPQSMKFVNPKLIFILSFNFFNLRGSAAGDCDDIQYTTIRDARRSTAFNSTILKRKLCDSTVIKDGDWYRFQSEAGGELPTTVPDLNTCGTFSPIWMNGSHPTVREGKVNRQACVYLLHTLPIGCGKSYNIGVVNCSGYYVYQLRDPGQCDAAYCAGKSEHFSCSNNIKHVLSDVVFKGSNVFLLYVTIATCNAATDHSHNVTFFVEFVL